MSRVPNIHQAFLSFFLALALVALGEQTYIFLQVMAGVNIKLTQITTYVYLWLYGFDLPGFFTTFHVDGSYQALLVIAVCIIGLKLCGSTPKAYSVVSAGEF